MKLGLIVEGHGEVQAVPLLMRRLLTALAPALHPAVLPPHRVARGQLVKEAELQRAIEFMARKVGEEGRILVLLDADDELPCQLGTGRESDGQTVPSRWSSRRESMRPGWPPGAWTPSISSSARSDTCSVFLFRPVHPLEIARWLVARLRAAGGRTGGRFIVEAVARQRDGGVVRGEQATSARASPSPEDARPTRTGWPPSSSVG
jgi:hypothetical protein